MNNMEKPKKNSEIPNLSQASTSEASRHIDSIEPIVDIGPENVTSTILNTIKKGFDYESIFNEQKNQNMVTTTNLGLKMRIVCTLESPSGTTSKEIEVKGTKETFASDIAEKVTQMIDLLNLVGPQTLSFLKLGGINYYDGDNPENELGHGLRTLIWKKPTTENQSTTAF